MPKKVINKLEKVISTKVSLEAYNVLAATAKSAYMRDDIMQPTISEILRYMIEISMSGKLEDESKMLTLVGDFHKYRKQKIISKK